ncbi:MAG: hypothetical protein C4523_11735 [Myxococcales bacterium]|nr:MAG: hypothetical protein C4523_11735 [Myxococcales bacterium]
MIPLLPLACSDESGGTSPPNTDGDADGSIEIEIDLAEDESESSESDFENGDKDIEPTDGDEEENPETGIEEADDIDFLDEEPQEENPPDLNLIDRFYFDAAETCPLPELRFSPWILDFPRVPVGASLWSILPLGDGSAVFSNKQVALIAPDGTATTYFPAIKGDNIGTHDNRNWYRSTGQQLWRYDASALEWELVFELPESLPPYELPPFLPKAVSVDSHDRVWATDRMGVWFYPLIFLWDGTTGRWIGTEQAGIILDGPMQECNGNLYFFQSSREVSGGDPTKGDAAILRFNETSEQLELLWQSNLHLEISDVLLSATLEPETCRFVAAGYNIIVHGRLLPELQIERVEFRSDTSQPGRPWLIWTDWQTNTLWGTIDVSQHSEDPWRFARRDIDGEAFERIEPFTAESGYYHWIPRSIWGDGNGRVYVTASDVLYMYDPQTGRFDYPWKSDLLGKTPDELGTSFFRAISVHQNGAQDAVRVCAAGYKLPVLCKTGCHGWEELFPASEGARALFDAGEAIWVAGVWPHLVKVGDQAVETVPGPDPAWRVATSVARTSSGLFATAWYDDYGDDSRLLYLPMPGPQRSARYTPWKTLDLPNASGRWQPYELLAAGGETYLVARNKARLETTTHEEDNCTRLYRLNEKNPIESIPELKADLYDCGYIRVHDGNLYFASRNGGFELDPETGALVQRVPPLPEERDNWAVTDILPAANGKYLGLSEMPFEYDPESGDFTFYWMAHGSGGDMNPFQPPELASEREFNDTPLRFERLPSGEVLALDQEGWLLLRVTEEAWRSTRTSAP